MEIFEVMLVVYSMEEPRNPIRSRKLHIAGSLPFKPAKGDVISVPENGGTRVGVMVTKADWRARPDKNFVGGVFVLNAVPDQACLINGTMLAERICAAFEASHWVVAHIFDEPLT